ncbi:hypothetical protein MBANPS3_004074 [Mucor bainieri]
MNKKCIPQELHYRDDESSTESYHSGYYYEDQQDDMDHDTTTTTAELDALYGQVRDLEKQLQHLELDLQQEKAVIKSEPRWDICCVDGELRLATEIRNLEELMMYGQAAIRYLSPFGHTFQAKKSLLFERKSLSFVKTAMQLVTIAYDMTNPDSVSSPKVISRRFSVGVPAFLKPQSLVRRLIDNYFSCSNDTIPILHEPTFMAHVWGLANPMEDPVVLAVCTCAAVVTCKHNFLNSSEKRYFSEFFYERSIAKLVDMFDDPDKALESVLVINLMQPFLMQTLRVAESYKWVSMGMLLCKNLQTEHPGYAQGGPHLSRMVRIKYALIHRNSVLCDCAMAIIDFVKNDKRREIEPNHVQFDTLPDETRKVKNTLFMFNQMLSLSLHPSFIAVVTQARQLAAGDVAQLSFEEIIRYEETVIEWWHSLPEELKMCTEPFNLTKEVVERETDERKILMASYVHTITLSIQGCLIRPKPQRNVENVYTIIKDRAIYLAMHSADMSLLLMKQIEKIDSFCYSPSKLLVRSIDSLMSLLQVSDDAMAKMAQQKLSEYMHALTKQVLPDHQVPPSASPYGMITVAPKGSTPPVTELYKNFPLPGEALIFDVVRTTVERNAKLLALDIST